MMFKIPYIVNHLGYSRKRWIKRGISNRGNQNYSSLFMCFVDPWKSYIIGIVHLEFQRWFCLFVLFCFIFVRFAYFNILKHFHFVWPQTQIHVFIIFQQFMSWTKNMSSKLIVDFLGRSLLDSMFFQLKNGNLMSARNASVK